MERLIRRADIHRTKERNHWAVRRIPLNSHAPADIVTTYGESPEGEFLASYHAGRLDEKEKTEAYLDRRTKRATYDHTYLDPLVRYIRTNNPGEFVTHTVDDGLTDERGETQEKKTA